MNFFKNSHTRETLQLAWPLVLTQVSYVITGMVDNIFLGRIGVAEQAAGILSNNLFVLVLVFLIGVSFGITPLTTAAHENGKSEDKAVLFKNALFLNLLIAALSFIVLYVSSGALRHMKQPQDVVDLAIPFYNVMIFSIVPLSVFFTCKQFFEGLSNTRTALVISVAGNVVNIVLNYCLIYGKMGLPEMGYMGSAWATFISRTGMALAFLLVVFRAEITRDIRAYYGKVKVNYANSFQLAKIGINSGLQFTFEVAAFVIAGLMAGSFGKEQIDGHGIALQLASFTYMFASGISSAATIRVGVFKAKNEWKNIQEAGLVSAKLVMLFMGSFGVLFLLLRNVLPMAFTEDAAIIELSSQLLIIAALFQLFDGLQVTFIGVLRGLEDVSVSTYVTLVGYWVIALPMSYIFAFTIQLEVLGIWIALFISLVLVSIGLYYRFKYITSHHLKNLNTN